MKEKINYREKVLSQWQVEVEKEKDAFVIYGVLKTGRVKIGEGKTEVSAFQAAAKWCS